MKTITRKNLIPAAIAFVLITVLIITGKIYPETIVQVFSFPAAKITSLFLGVPFFKTDGLTYTLFYSNVSLNIIESCSGYNFWVILFSYFMFQILSRFYLKRAVTYCVFLLPASYFITIIVNSIRVIASLYIRISGSSYISEKYADVIHLWTGIIIFLSALIAMQILFQRRISHES
jgi:exosortase K